MLPSCGATGVSHESEPPCQASTQVVSPIWLEKEPSSPNTNASSKRHGRSATPALLPVFVANHSLLPAVGPTPAALSPASFQEPVRVIGSGSTQPSVQYSTALSSVVALLATPSTPLISVKEIVKLTTPSISSSVISRTAVQSPILPLTSATKPPIVTSGCISASLASKDTEIESPNLAVPSAAAVLVLDCLIETFSRVGAMPSGPGSAALLSVTVFPPPPQAVRIKERDSAKIAPK